MKCEAGDIVYQPDHPEKSRWLVLQYSNRSYAYVLLNTNKFPIISFLNKVTHGDTPLRKGFVKI